MPDIRRACFVLMTLVAVSLGHAQAPESGPPERRQLAFEEDAAAQESLPTFRGELDVNLINLFVTVVDGDGRPVSGLGAEDFEVFEDGDRVEITNFEAIDRRELTPVELEASSPAPSEPEGDAVEPAPRGRYVALLFDNESLERRNRRKILKSMEDFIDEGLERGDRYMIALNSGSLEVLKPFTTNGPGLKAALRSIAEMPSDGDAIKKRKRYLKRTIYNEEIFRSARLPGTGSGMDPNTSYAIASSQRLMTELTSMRRIEHERIRRALDVNVELLRAVAGVEGRKSVVWVGEDLAMRPMLDVYNVWYSRSAPLGAVMTVLPPEIWGEELKLDQEFEAVAASAQASGATFYIIDASDRDRELATADFSPPNAVSVFLSEAVNTNVWTPGANLAEIRDLSEGAEYMAVATGGMMFTNTRDVERVVDTLTDQVSSYYYLGYRRAGPPDGRRHDLKIRVRGDGLRVRHHDQILDRTMPQRLADVAMARLRLDVGDNDLGLEVSLEQPEPADGRTFVQPVQLAMPVDRLVLIPDAERHIGQILVAVAVLDDEGNTTPAHMIRLRLAIPSASMSDDAIAVQRIRLLMREGTRRIAISVRDEVSGIEASQAVGIAGSEL